MAAVHPKHLLPFVRRRDAGYRHASCRKGPKRISLSPQCVKRRLRPVTPYEAGGRDLPFEQDCANAGAFRILQYSSGSRRGGPRPVRCPARGICRMPRHRTIRPLRGLCQQGRNRPRPAVEVAGLPRLPPSNPAETDRGCARDIRLSRSRWSNAPQGAHAPLLHYVFRDFSSYCFPASCHVKCGPSDRRTQEAYHDAGLLRKRLSHCSLRFGEILAASDSMSPSNRSPRRRSSYRKCCWRTTLAAQYAMPCMAAREIGRGATNVRSRSMAEFIPVGVLCSGSLVRLAAPARAGRRGLRRVAMSPERRMMLLAETGPGAARSSDIRDGGARPPRAGSAVSVGHTLRTCPPYESRPGGACDAPPLINNVDRGLVGMAAFPSRLRRRRIRSLGTKKGAPTSRPPRGDW